MKKLHVILTTGIALVMPLIVFAHSDDSVAVARGQQLDTAVRADATQCGKMSTEDFEAIGEFYMDRMMGSQHETMNETMVEFIGESGEEQMHTVMGKRMSGCDPAAAMSSAQGQMMGNMMSMMMGGSGMVNNSVMSGRMPVSALPFGMYGWSWSTVILSIWAVVGFLAILWLVLKIIKVGREVLKK